MSNRPLPPQPGLPPHTGICGDGEKICPRCDGGGVVPAFPPRPQPVKTCPRCGGSGCVEDTGESEEEYYAI